MADAAREFEHESLQDRDSIVQFLAALGEGFQQGKLVLSRNSTRLVLETPQLVKFSVRAKQKQHRAEITMKISWKDRHKGKALKVEPLVIESPTESR